MQFYKKAYYFLILASLLVTGVVSSAHAKDISSPFLDAPLHETVLGVRGPDNGKTRLQVTVYLPDGRGPFPLAVVNAGANAVPGAHPELRLGYTFLTGYFLSRGYAVAQPMPQGFGESSGKPITNGCALDQTGLLNAQDIKAVLHNMSAIVELDMSRVVIAGQGFGGWTSLALSTLQVPGQRGQIVFSPVLQDRSCQQGDAALVQGAEKLGAASHQMPTLWLESRPGSLVSEATWRQMFAVYRKGNAHASMPDVPVIKKDTLTLTGSVENLSLWMPKLDAFLQTLGLPAQDVQSGYLPSVLKDPVETHFAKLDDVNALPIQSEGAIALYKTFLKKPFPRAFAFGDTAGAADSRDENPRAMALKNCALLTTNCHLYAYNDKIVWKGKIHDRVSVRSVAMTHYQTLTLFEVSLDKNCKEEFIPQIRITRPPTHGRLVIVPDVMGVPSYRPPAPQAQCRQPVHGAAIQYRPVSDYDGNDNFIIEEQTNREHTRHSTAVLNISIH